MNIPNAVTFKRTVAQSLASTEGGGDKQDQSEQPWGIFTQDTITNDCSPPVSCPTETRELSGQEGGYNFPNNWEKSYKWKVEFIITIMHCWLI